MAGLKATDLDIRGHHLPYELWMLQSSYLRLAKCRLEPVIANALIESFCIHARLLIEFFSNQQGCRAEEFTGGVYMAVHLGSLRKEVVKLNTQIAHLTRARTTIPDEKIGPVDRLKWLKALEREAGNFSVHLAPQFKGMFTPPMPLIAITNERPWNITAPNS